MSLDLQAIRAQFPLQDAVYFDNPAGTQVPQRVIDALVAYYSGFNANIHRGIHTLAEKATQAFEQTRTTAQSFIHAGSAEEIIFTRGVTEGINLVASSYGRAFVNEGDEIIISTLEHHSNIVPWQLVCEEKKATLKIIPVNRDGEIDLEAFKTLLSSRTRIVSVNHASNSLGTINPVKEIIRLAHAAGAVVLIDGAQAGAHLEIDVQDLDCDFYCLSSHKMYGPTGVGVLWGRADILAGMPPWQGGGAMIERVTFERTTYAPPPQRFEAGTPMIAEAIALHAAVDYVASIGVDQLLDHERTLARTLREELRKLNSVGLFGPDDSAGIVSFAMEGVHPHDLGTILDEENVAIRAGHHCAQPLMEALGVPATARASFGLYSDESDIAALLRGIERTQRIFG